MRQPVGVALLGLGVPTAAAGGLLFYLLFLPGRGGHVLVHFSEDHPAARVAGVIFLVGLAMTVPGLWLVLSPARPAAERAPAKPLTFGDGPP